MKPIHPAPFLPRSPWLVAVLLATGVGTGVGCGSGGGEPSVQARDANEPDSSSTPDGATQTQVDAGLDAWADATGSFDGGNADAGLDADTYTGAIVAAIFQVDSSTSYGAFTVFSTGAPFALGGCTNGDAGDCCVCIDGVVTPPPPVQPPDAANVTLRSSDGTTLATMAPTSPIENEDTVSFDMYGTSELGWWGFGGVSSYPPAASLPPWDPGDELTVSASGDQVHAFTGILYTGGVLAGLAPSFAAGNLTIDRTKDLVVSWTPEDAAEEVSIYLTQGLGRNCFCAAPDSAGSLTLDTSVLSQFSPSQDAGLDEQPEGAITVERLRITPIHTDNARVDLVGAVQVTAEANFL